MPRSVFLFLLIVSVASSSTCLATTNLPSLSLSEAFINYNGPGTPSLLVVPDGSGPPFTEARDMTGQLVDATITMYLRDPQGVPIHNFPWEDIWFETEDAGLVSCIWGVHPDSPTDVNGVTRWTQPAQAGGASEGPVFVLVIGSRLTSNDGLPLRFNSPDINADGLVNLTDTARLGSDYFSAYHFRSDFNGDGQLSLSDLPPFARAFGAQCP